MKSSGSSMMQIRGTLPWDTAQADLARGVEAQAEQEANGEHLRRVSDAVEQARAAARAEADHRVRVTSVLRALAPSLPQLPGRHQVHQADDHQESSGDRRA
eukprot:CAMPEP_0115483778 /NCGR_PEP_ID=MMETSP0271-20121206/59032_1 /TAXON_ID=71861 /ORGANISM="Scrippsiella trochoidea, Strain CCMP3099" /LENGTH=100 /DNA_ID=CAMNT_0002911641 /DNA_START=171 /DNA_END=473 /DNA_ORIENTATION=+